MLKLNSENAAGFSFGRVMGSEVVAAAAGLPNNTDVDVAVDVAASGWLPIKPDLAKVVADVDVFVGMPKKPDLIGVVPVAAPNIPVVTGVVAAVAAVAGVAGVAAVATVAADAGVPNNPDLKRVVVVADEGVRKNPDVAGEVVVADAGV